MTWYHLALISAVFSAFAAVSEKKALFKIDALNFSWLVSIITLVFSIPFFFNATLHIEFSVPLLILFVKAFLSALAFLSVMLALKSLDISEALPLLALSPGLVAVAGVILINDNLVLNEWIGLFLMLAGTYVLELKKGIKNVADPFRSLLSFNKYKHVFTALLLFTISSLIDRSLLKDFKLPPVVFMAYQQLFFAVIFTIFVLIKGKSGYSGLRVITWKLFNLFVLISLFTVVYRYTQIEATKLAPVALVLSVKRLSVLMAIIIGGTLFREKELWKRVFAAIVILTGLVFLLNG